VQVFRDEVDDTPDKSEDLGISKKNGEFAKAISLGFLAESNFGVPVIVRVRQSDESFIERYTWYRPRKGLSVGYGFLGVALAWSNFEFEQQPKVLVVPATASLQYRMFFEDGGYLFTGIALGPHLGYDQNADDDEADPPEESFVYGALALATLNLAGFEIGFGAYGDFANNDIGPVVSLTFSEAFLKATGAIKYPNGIWSRSGE
jgi:hypothetical protein